MKRIYKSFKKLKISFKINMNNNQEKLIKEIYKFWLSQDYDVWFKENKTFDIQIRKKYLIIMLCTYLGYFNHWIYNSKSILNLNYYIRSIL